MHTLEETFKPSILADELLEGHVDLTSPLNPVSRDKEHPREGI